MEKIYIDRDQLDKRFRRELAKVRTRQSISDPDFIFRINPRPKPKPRKHQVDKKTIDGIIEKEIKKSLREKTNNIYDEKKPIRKSYDELISHTIVDSIPPKPAPAVIPSKFGRGIINKNIFKHNKIAPAFATIAMIVGLAGAVYAFVVNHSADRYIEARNSDNTNQNYAINETEPSEDDLSNHKVPPLAPRIITIPQIGVKAKVSPMGTDKDGKLKAPDNTHNVGWYSDSSTPGSGGAVLLDGHKLGPTKAGVFYGLDKLKSGAGITIERGDGKLVSYTVVTSKTFPADQTDMNSAMLSVTSGVEGLNLISCTGQFDNIKNTYSDRIIVYATKN